jgi:ribosome-binding protein aMBF1 (putative translation factor)
VNRTEAATAAAIVAHLLRDRFKLFDSPDEPEPGAAGLPERVRNCRITIGLSTEELGRRAGLSGFAVRAIENGGGAKLETVEKLATALTGALREQTGDDAQTVSPNELAGWI